MALFDGLKGKLADAGQNVSQQTRNMSELARLNNLIAETKRKLSAQCFELGKQYYQAHQADEAPEFPEAVSAIRGLLDEIKESEEAVLLLKGIKKCPTCGTEVPIQSVFCPGCGTQIGTPPRCCPACGKEAKEGSLFCVYCGTKID
ncbi:MAG: zinc ribbon domain-containing protein [Oscillospiraceae bacterium]|nr:zinc ribbon domain-containing protein [Oscillospiraceae bacterium]